MPVSKDRCILYLQMERLDANGEYRLHECCNLRRAELLLMNDGDREAGSGSIAGPLYKKQRY